MYEDPPEEDLVEMAVKFFSNPDVRKSPYSQQEEFLKKKGLTSEQIKTAYERSRSQVVNVPEVEHVGTVQPANLALKVSWHRKLKDFFSTLAFLVGASYGFYYLYKRFIKSYLFGEPKKPKTIDSPASPTIEQSISDLKIDMQKIQTELKRVVLMQSDAHSQSMQLADIKSEVVSLKAMLLTKHEYTKVGIPAIPAWQLSAKAQKCVKDDKGTIENEEGEHHSETECGANPNSNGGSQGSDSSLEMIKEVDS